MKSLIFLLLIATLLTGCGGNKASEAEEQQLEDLLYEYLTAYEAFHFEEVERLKEELERMLDATQFRDDTNEVLSGFVASINEAKYVGLDAYKLYLKNDVPAAYDGIFNEVLLQHKMEVTHE
ncbi:hypothetical protein BpOF4_06240 [Alkalihalophilus pseudofirmus OF4]|uniref:Lipoprotein n=1 Tax=Alkalihalophilus pseudofirmus (strain ATCC BAA-2126 / JCM 17055 / OF4) TaxID=398511 RepID=D3FZR6_ALKPO|nr:hypothetical protein [Alkalihalophilus pseudofirmus]ADC49308.1 hypothetical protein BpOF4_06240 [Alkalihalophilus pseudofirmus OF4]